MASCGVRKFRHTEVIHRKLFLNFVKMHNCVWHLWTCQTQNTGLHNFGGQTGLGFCFSGGWGGEGGRGIDCSYYCQSIVLHDSKMLKWKKVLQRIIIRFSNFGPSWDNIGGFSVMGQGIGRSPALAKIFSFCSPPSRKIPQLVDPPTKFLAYSTKSQNTKFHVLTK